MGGGEEEGRKGRGKGERCEEEDEREGERGGTIMTKVFKETIICKMSLVSNNMGYIYIDIRFALTIIHGSRRAVKTGKAWQHSLCE